MNESRFHQQIDRQNDILDAINQSLMTLNETLSKMRGPYIHENEATREDEQESGHFTEENYYGLYRL